MLKKIAATALLSAFLASPALASQCPGLMKDVDAAMETSAPDDPQVQEQIKDLRAEGEALHKSGDHAASFEKLQQALALIDENKG